MLIKTEVASTTEPSAAAAAATSGSAIFRFCCTFTPYRCIEVLLHAFNKSLFLVSRRIKFALLVDLVCVAKYNIIINFRNIVSL